MQATMDHGARRRGRRLAGALGAIVVLASLVGASTASAGIPPTLTVTPTTVAVGGTLTVEATCPGEPDVYVTDGEVFEPIALTSTGPTWVAEIPVDIEADETFEVWFVGSCGETPYTDVLVTVVVDSTTTSTTTTAPPTTGPAIDPPTAPAPPAAAPVAASPSYTG